MKLKKNYKKTHNKKIAIKRMRTILEIKTNKRIFYICKLKDEIEKKIQFHNRIKKNNKD
jgi:hypothetical protein